MWASGTAMAMDDEGKRKGRSSAEGAPPQSLAFGLVVDAAELGEAVGGKAGIEGMEAIGERADDVLVGLLGEVRGIVLKADAAECVCDEFIMLSCEH